MQIRDLSQPGPSGVQIAQNKIPKKSSSVPDISPGKALDLVLLVPVITLAAKKARPQIAGVLSSDQCISKQPKTKRLKSRRRPPLRQNLKKWFEIILKKKDDLAIRRMSVLDAAKISEKRRRKTTGFSFMWRVCDARNSYPLTGQIYTGEVTATREINQGERAVKDLCHRYKSSSRNVTMDNFFISLR
ncbi:hypothetical protein ILUMI_24766 [Ignelater luminosus]|uniref:PiggyBac transposable element-derived protein domain-containing protein n=1 Tax=Ignelater luminosus TaxID=2038154 RepID=A0A8K0CBV2_IGNLU|nr:hypothetical protein ILUMI_24766 [Ignelater luminosus]